MDGESFQVLALDGGGYKGLFSAAVLAAIEQDLGHPVLEHFDLVVGTSTGGILALGLGRGLSPDQLVDFYSTWGPRIFVATGVGTGWGWWLRRYRPDALRAGLAEVLGEARLEDSVVPLVIPAFDLGRNQVHVFKTPHHPRLRRDGRERMVDVALATAAAPTYFPTHVVRGMRLIDGGVWANNPVLVGIAEAVSLFGMPLDAVGVFSLGTTSDAVYHGEHLDHGGRLRWASTAADLVVGAQSVGASGIAEHLIGKDRYLRHDPAVPANVLRMDRVDTARLIAAAESTSRHIVPDFEAKFGHHIASRLPFTRVQSGVTT